MKKNKRKEATFLYRLCAYILDVCLVSAVAALLCYPFVDSSKTEDIYKNQLKIEEQYSNKEITKKQYTELKINSVYQDYKNNGLSYIFTILLGILYFGVFQFYNKGQTLGKRLLKIKVKADKGDLTMNQLLLRSLIVDSILLNIIIFIFMLFANKTTFYYSMISFSVIEYIILFVCFIMIKVRKDRKGLHDLMFNTTVVYNEVK